MSSTGRAGFGSIDELGRDVGSVDLADYGSRLRRRWWIVLAFLAMGVGAAYYVTDKQTPTYAASTTVQVLPSTLTGTSNVVGGRTNGPVNLDTESQIVQSAAVAVTAKQLLKTDATVDVLLRGVTVTVPPNSSIVKVNYEASSARGAQQGSHAFAQAYIQHRADDYKAEITQTLSQLSSQLADLNRQLVAVTAKSATFPDNSADRALADAQKQILSNQITDISSRLVPLRSALSEPETARIITDATMPKRPTSPVPPVNLAAGVLAGLLLGVAAAMLADRFDKRVRRRSDVTRHVGVPLLSDVGLGRLQRGVPDARAAAVFDRLRTAVRRSAPETSVVQVADHGRHGSAGVVALQLARSWARVAQRATLIVASERSLVPDLVKVADRPGLVELVRDQVGLDQVLYEVPDVPGLVVIPIGKDTDALADALQSPRMTVLLDGLRAGGGGVVIETDAPGESVGAQAVVGGCDVLVMVAEKGRTDARRLSASVREAEQGDVPVAGVVMVPGRAPSSLGERAFAAARTPAAARLAPASAEAPSKR